MPLNKDGFEAGKLLSLEEQVALRAKQNASEKTPPAKNTRRKNSAKAKAEVQAESDQGIFEDSAARSGSDS